MQRRMTKKSIRNFGTGRRLSRDIGVRARIIAARCGMPRDIQKSMAGSPLDLFAEILRERQISPAVAVVLGVRFAGEGAPFSVALPAFLQSYIANLVTAGVRLIPLGQTDGQLAIAELEHVIEAASAQAAASTIDDLGSAAFMVDLASMAHETQYTRLFRS